MYLYIKNGYMVTLLDYCNDANGFRCNRHGYKWLLWLQAKNRYNKDAKQGHLSPNVSKPNLHQMLSLVFH